VQPIDAPLAFQLIHPGFTRARLRLSRRAHGIPEVKGGCNDMVPTRLRVRIADRGVGICFKGRRG
jgi:hypothetical protein